MALSLKQYLRVFVVVAGGGLVPAPAVPSTSYAPQTTETAPSTMTTYTVFPLPESIEEPSCTLWPSRYFLNSRPCPSLDCATRPDPASCTKAPASVINGPFAAIYSDCSEIYYGGHACTSCGDNYCTRGLYLGETSLGDCPLGLMTTVGARECAEPDCGMVDPIPECNGVTPVMDYAPQVYTDWGACTVRIGTGLPCTGCGLLCTVNGNVPGHPITEGRCPGEDLRTTTVGVACPSLTCDIPDVPTQCPTEETGTAEAEARSTPWTDTVWCNVYVQTGGTETSCPSCVQLCTSTPAPELTMFHRVD